MLLGAIIGDIVGSTRKQGSANTRIKELLPEGSHFTGNTVLTLAVAEWIILPTYASVSVCSLPMM